jgi:Sec-independent protein translocase protein TatA
MIANVGDLPYVIVIALIVLVGGSQLPKIARNVGLAGKEFRKAQDEAEETEKNRKNSAASQPTASAALPAASPTIPATPPVPPASVPAAIPVDTGAAPAASVASAPPADPSITLTPAQLDALLKAREEQVRSEGQSN